MVYPTICEILVLYSDTDSASVLGDVFGWGSSDHHVGETWAQCCSNSGLLDRNTVRLVWEQRRFSCCNSCGDKVAFEQELLPEGHRWWWVVSVQFCSYFPWIRIICKLSSPRIKNETFQVHIQCISWCHPEISMPMMSLLSICHLAFASFFALV